MSRVPLHTAFVAAGMLTLACSEQAAAQTQKESGSVPSAEAKALHDKGREAGGRGDHAAALKLFTDAAALAPDWPYPVYDRAFTHLLMNNPDAALLDYQETLKRSPGGFFTAHVAVDTLLREKRGEFPAGLYMAYSMLEAEQDRERQRMILQQIVEKVPRFAPGWQKFSSFAATPKERLERIDAGLAAEPDPETLGMLKLNKAEVLRALGKQDEATEILRAVVSDPKSTLAAIAWAKVLLDRK